METLITIKTIDINELRIEKSNPNTKRRTQISKDVVQKFIDFQGERKASIEKEDLKKLKPEIDVDNFSEYEENPSLEQLFKKLGKSNAILVNKYGYTNLNVSPEALEKAVNESLEEPINIIKQQQEEIERLKEENAKLLRKNKVIRETITENDNINPENNIVQFPIYEIDDNNLEDLPLDEIDDDIKIIA